jgi:phosphatidylglycerol:prolipoprotein diacylglycerol transferase
LFPVLATLRFGGRQLGVHSYGVLIAVGLACGVALAYREGKRQKLDGGRVVDLAFWLIVSGLIGARLAYLLVNADDFARICAGSGAPPRGARLIWTDCTRAFRVWEGGLVFYGGVVAAAAFAFRFARREGWWPARIADLFAPCLALGHAFGRLGCFAAGCCYGKELNIDWGVFEFPPGSVAFEQYVAAGMSPGAGTTPPLHPTQLYEAAGELAIFAALMALRGRLRPRPGSLLLVYLALYALLRFVVEAFRGDYARRFVLSLDTPRLANLLHLPPNEPLLLSVGQLGSLIVMLAVAFELRRRRRRRVTGATAATTSSPAPAGDLIG